MRILVITLICGIVPLTHAADRYRTVDLDNPGTLEALKAADPQRYRQIVDIVRVSSETRCKSIAETLRTQFDVKQSQCNSFTLLTSEPPQGVLSFKLDDTTYVTRIRLRYEADPMASPAR